MPQCTTDKVTYLISNARMMALLPPSVCSPRYVHWSVLVCIDRILPNMVLLLNVRPVGREVLLALHFYRPAVDGCSVITFVPNKT